MKKLSFSTNFRSRRFRWHMKALDSNKQHSKFPGDRTTHRRDTAILNLRFCRKLMKNCCFWS